MLLQDQHIFIVEDNSANAAITTMLLQMHGAITHMDQWGTHTIHHLLALKQVDLILMDLMLRNGLTGYDVLTQIKDQPALADIPCVVLSASDPTVELARARASGFDGYITKPLDFNEFPRMIARILEGEPVWADGWF